MGCFGNFLTCTPVILCSTHNDQESRERISFLYFILLYRGQWLYRRVGVLKIFFEFLTGICFYGFMMSSQPLLRELVNCEIISALSKGPWLPLVTYRPKSERFFTLRWDLINLHSHVTSRNQSTFPRKEEREPWERGGSCNG